MRFSNESTYKHYMHILIHGYKINDENDVDRKQQTRKWTDSFIRMAPMEQCKENHAWFHNHLFCTTNVHLNFYHEMLSGRYGLYGKLYRAVAVALAITGMLEGAVAISRARLAYTRLVHAKEVNVLTYRTQICMSLFRPCF